MFGISCQGTVITLKDRPHVLHQHRGGGRGFGIADANVISTQ